MLSFSLPPTMSFSAAIEAVRPVRMRLTLQSGGTDLHTDAALVNLHAELLGPILLFSRIGTSHVSRDTLIALMIVTCRKPIQQADSVGSAIPLVTQVVSKFNDSMAYISVGLMIRIAGLLGLRKHMMRVLGVAGPASPSTEDVALCRAFFYLYISAFFHLPSELILTPRKSTDKPRRRLAAGSPLIRSMTRPWQNASPRSIDRRETSD